MNIEHINPQDIEKRSFEIITEIIEKEYSDKIIQKEQQAIIKRVIHTTADFEYLSTLCFCNDAIQKGKQALQKGACIVTDTNMVKSGINKKFVEHLGGEVCCFMSDKDVAETAKKQNITRAVASMEKATQLQKPLIFAIGNAPTALIKIYELVKQNKIKPELIIAVPVGFVNVIQAKELILSLSVPSIVAKGRKGGSNVAAAICNALLYELITREK
ncbi:precorrin-8X methylmutase [Clostridium sp. MD294]|uniref:precorrin-8X methylmutase n=1 Tax=Clostridium sp. MD294 TaxID=97138 RepID=UPI0002CCB390|nr:precorrin-8X methylmutase [Clostridium sp. MD294]NDO45577.1 precorrin-8X methylmutase [Clostridium sp. MD294]USF30769.1 Cobalt-precorrin-8 methylmutase [Clostridium sp. MD294]